VSFVEDVARTVQSGQAALQSVVGVAAEIERLRPLADRALRGDRSADAELAGLATDPYQPAATNAAARLLIEYVRLRKKVGTAATGAGLGIYPGQVSPLILAGVVLLLLVVWRRRRA